MEIETKKVSIIMPTYNGSKYISHAIQSVIDQTYINWELIIVNDGSIDNTEDVVKEFQKLDNRIFYFKNEKNIGAEKTRNLCLEKSTGYYIASIDDDDIWCDSEKLEKQVDFLEKNSDYVLVGTGVIFINEEQKELYRKLSTVEDKNIRRKLLLSNGFINSSILFKKSVALSLGGYSESNKTRHIDDYDLILKLGTVGKLYNLPIYSVEYTFRKGSISSVNALAQIKGCFVLIKKYKNNYPNYWIAFFVLSVRITLYHLKLFFK